MSRSKSPLFFLVWSFYVRPSPCLKLLSPNDWQRISNPHRSLELHHSTSASMTSNKDLFFSSFSLVVLLESIFGENNWSNHLSDKIYPTSAAQWETWNMCATHASTGLCHCLYYDICFFFVIVFVISQCTCKSYRSHKLFSFFFAVFLAVFFAICKKYR